MWDCVAGISQDYFFSQSYLQGKHGVIIVGDAKKLTMMPEAESKGKELKSQI